mmetsp:Transcript_76483/g.224466  ORF Transcript_76483/g.224466 Transcript_76483/m.224466 type:complete len:351 (-) Transcript_76483:453-1505(-)
MPPGGQRRQLLLAVQRLAEIPEDNGPQPRHVQVVAQHARGAEDVRAAGVVLVRSLLAPPLPQLAQAGRAGVEEAGLHAQVPQPLRHLLRTLRPAVEDQRRAPVQVVHLQQPRHGLLPLFARGQRRRRDHEVGHLAAPAAPRRQGRVLQGRVEAVREVRLPLVPEARAELRGQLRGHALPDGRAVPPELTPLQLVRVVDDLDAGAQTSQRLGPTERADKDLRIVVDVLLGISHEDGVQVEGLGPQVQHHALRHVAPRQDHYVPRARVALQVALQDEADEEGLARAAGEVEAQGSGGRGLPEEQLHGPLLVRQRRQLAMRPEAASGLRRRLLLPPPCAPLFQLAHQLPCVQL